MGTVQFGRDRTSEPSPAGRSPRRRRTQATQGDQPELASAVDMQLALVEMQRRVQGRVPLPWIQPDPEWLRRAAGGRPAARALQRHPARLDRLPPDVPADRRHPAALRGARAAGLRRRSSRSAATATRSSRSSPAGTKRRRVSSAGATRENAQPDGLAAGLDQVLRARAAAVPGALRRSARASVSTSPDGRTGTVRICGWEPDFAVITPGADRRLILRPLRRRSGRSRRSPARSARTTTARCITSFATRDGRYRVYACDVCRRYLKAYDGRNAHATGDGGRGFDCDAAARRGGHAAGVRVVIRDQGLGTRIRDCGLGFRDR